MLDHKLIKPAVLYRGKEWSIDLFKAILEEYYCQKIIKKHFNKTLIISVADERRFQWSNKCWICNKSFTDEDKKAKDFDHITERYWGSPHSNSNTNLKLTKNVPEIFHNLRGYDGHSIMEEISKCDVEIRVIPNGLEKHMAFTINENFIFIGSIQFKKSSLGFLVKNLSNNDFKLLLQEFNGDLLKLVKQKEVHLYKCMGSLLKNNYLIDLNFLVP